MSLGSSCPFRRTRTTENHIAPFQGIRHTTQTYQPAAPPSCQACWSRWSAVRWYCSRSRNTRKRDPRWPKTTDQTRTNCSLSLLRTHADWQALRVPKIKMTTKQRFNKLQNHRYTLQTHINDWPGARTNGAGAPTNMRKRAVCHTKDSSRRAT